MRMRRFLALVLLFVFYSVGPTSGGPEAPVQARGSQVNPMPADEVPLEEETRTFDGKTPIAIELDSGSKLAVGIGSLKSPTPITLKTFENRPAGGAPRSKAIGLRTVVEVPFSQLDLSNLMTESFFIYAPAFKGAYKGADHPVQEVAVSLNGGKEYVFLDSYIPDFAVVITPAILEAVTGTFSFRRGTLRVLVQPIDAGGVLWGLSDAE